MVSALSGIVDIETYSIPFSSCALVPCNWNNVFIGPSLCAIYFPVEPATCSEIQPADLPTETNNVRIASVTPQGVNVRALGDINEVQLYCRFDGIPEPTITWLDPDRQQLSSGAKFSITQSGGISILTIRNYNNDSDTGEYSCSIENGGGSQTCSATLGVCGRCIAGDWSEVCMDSYVHSSCNSLYNNTLL